MELKYAFLTFCLLLLLGHSTQACTCECSNRTLCQLTKVDPAAPVLHGRVLEYNELDYYWLIEVVEQFAGTSVRDTIVIDQGGSCSEPVMIKDYTFAETGDEVILRLQPINTSDTLQYPLYHQYSCSFVYLYLDQDEIHGKISANTGSLAIDDFRNYVSSEYKNDIFCRDCRCSCQFLKAAKFYLTVDSTFCRTHKVMLFEHPNALVASMVVEEIRDSQIVVRIKDVIEGYEPRERLTIWTLKGAECRTPSSDFEQGEEYISILLRLDNRGIVDPSEGIGDYYVSSCGNPILHVVRDSVYGVIATKIKSMTYAEVRLQILIGFKEVFNCHDWVNPSRTITEGKLEIFPNPSHGRFTVQVENNTIKSMTLLDHHGRRVVDVYGRGASQLDLEYPTNTTGVHMVKIQTGNGSIVTQKIVLMGE